MDALPIELLFMILVGRDRQGRLFLHVRWRWVVVRVCRTWRAIVADAPWCSMRETRCARGFWGRIARGRILCASACVERERAGLGPLVRGCKLLNLIVSLTTHGPAQGDGKVDAWKNVKYGGASDSMREAGYLTRRERNSRFLLPPTRWPLPHVLPVSR
jgi:hypothetical protein